MKIDEVRVYAEVLEQGIDFKEYLIKAGFSGRILNIYTKKSREGITSTDSLTDRIRKCKDVDVLITAISGNNEYPLLMVEYSAAVPTDDHKMQRSDVYYWGALFKVPMMKISPLDKGIKRSGGGGKKFDDAFEIALALHHGALLYPIDWQTVKYLGLDLDFLKIKKDALSCIYYEENITLIIKNILSVFSTSENRDEYYQNLRVSYKKTYQALLAKYENKDLKSIIKKSSRFKWQNNKLISKINRFGHAMDPDRGVLYATNMLLGASNCITEIQINRSSNFNARGGYKALFDATPHEESLSNYVKEIIAQKGNVFDDQDALHIFTHALNIASYNLPEKESEHKYRISDDKLKSFLENCPGMTAKCIFLLSTKLILTDKNRNTICEIAWNEAPVKTYLNSLMTTNYSPTRIKELTKTNMKEDIVTFASVELYKKIHCELLAVSYPGAQGDRCILAGKGRKALRNYIDIIAYKMDGPKVTVFLEECKASLSESPSDVKKLKEILHSKEKKAGLAILAQKVGGISKIDDTKISVGGKLVEKVPNLDVDYIFMFDIDNSVQGKTIIQYTVAIVNLKLASIFEPLLNKAGKLKGNLEFEKLYVIS